MPMPDSATPLQVFLDEKVTEIGWTEFLRRGKRTFTQGALQGWLRGAKPGPAYQAAIAAAAGVSLAYVKQLVWKSWEMQEATGALAVARRKRLGEGQRLAASRRARTLRRTLGGGLAVLLSAASASLAGATPRVETPRPISSATQVRDFVADLRDSVAYRTRRRRAA